MYLGEQVFNELQAIRTDTSKVMRFASLEADLAVFVHSPSLDPRYL